MIQLAFLEVWQLARTLQPSISTAQAQTYRQLLIRLNWLLMHTHLGDQRLIQEARQLQQELLPLGGTLSLVKSADLPDKLARM